MNTYYFDKDARIRFVCDARNVDDAIDYFADALRRCSEKLGVRIDVDTYIPDDYEGGDEND